MTKDLFKKYSKKELKKLLIDEEREFLTEEEETVHMTAGCICIEGVSEEFESTQEEVLDWLADEELQLKVKNEYG